VSGSAITASGTIRGAQLVNAQIGSTYAILDSDRGKLVTISYATAQATSIAQAGSGGSFLSGWFCDVENTGVGPVTITPTTSTIDGAASVALTTNQGVRIFSNGVNYFTQRGIGGGGGGLGDPGSNGVVKRTALNTTAIAIGSDLPLMTGDSGGGGAAGAVPAPAIGDATNCLKGSATWGACGGGATTPSILQSSCADAATLAMPLNVTTGDYLAVIAGANDASINLTDGVDTFVTVASGNWTATNYGVLAIAHISTTRPEVITNGSVTYPVLCAFEFIPPVGFTGTVDAYGSAITPLGVSLTTTVPGELVLAGVAYNRGGQFAVGGQPHVEAETASTDGATLGWFAPQAVGTYYSNYMYNVAITTDGVFLAGAVK
jgi:hypothetical protein